MISRVVILTFLILMFSSVSFGLYFIVDYFMDHGIPKAFGQSCEDYIHDDCSYINSHINTFNDFDYRNHVRCKMTLDAGSKPGATYKIKWLRFKVEATNCSDDKDYIEFYDMSLHYYYRLRKRDPFMGRFCGWTYPYPNLTDSLTQRYFTIVWHTNGDKVDKGWRFMATRVFPDPYCPGNDYYRCKAENICFDGRLKCDGIAQCDDQSDEAECQWWERLIGGFLALGTAGVTAISITVTFFCVVIGLTLRYVIKKLRKRDDQVIQINIGGPGGPGEPGGPGAPGAPGGVQEKRNPFEAIFAFFRTETEKPDSKKKDSKADNKEKKEKEKLPMTGAAPPKGTALGAAALGGAAAGGAAGAAGAKTAPNSQLPNSVTKESQKTTKESEKGKTVDTGKDAKTGTPAPGDKKTDANAPGEKQTVIAGLGGRVTSPSGQKAGAPGAPNTEPGATGTTKDVLPPLGAPGGPKSDTDPKSGATGGAAKKTEAAPGGPNAATKDIPKADKAPDAAKADNKTPGKTADAAKGNATGAGDKGSAGNNKVAPKK